MSAISRFFTMVSIILVFSACSNNDLPVDQSQLANGAVKDGLVGVIFAEVDPNNISSSAAGLAQIGKAVPLRIDSLMGLGSNAKSLTAMLTAAMVEDGLIQWNSTLAELLPEFTDDMLESYRNITLEELINHKSGLLALTDKDEAATFDLTALPDDSLQRRALAAKWILAQEPAGERGELLYSNAGYIVVSVVLEQLTGLDFNLLLQDRILEPLGLSVGSAAPAAQDPDQPYGHYADSNKKVEVLDPEDPTDNLINDIFVATGTLSMNPANYGLYLQWHLRAFQGEDTPIPFNYIDTLQNLEETQYALGWFGGRLKDKNILFHSGATSGFESLAVVALDGERAVFGLTNTSSDSWTLAVLNKWLLRLF